jgi:hypothetical protein
MSYSRGFGLNGKSFYTNVTMPKSVWCNFVIDSTNGNQLGIRSLKSNGYIEHVYMNTSAGAPAGSPNLGTARSYGVLAATTTTAAGTSTVTGNLGLYPGTAVTGYPPSTVSGVENIANIAAQNAKASAQAAFTAANLLTPTPIAADLGGQTLTPGVYSESSGTFSLAGNTGTLTLNGAGVYIFQASSTVIFGSAANYTFTLTGGARAQDIYWIVGSSATINSGHTGTFSGNVIAATSITVTTAGPVNGSLIALTGAVTLTGNIAVTAVPLAPTVTSGNPNPLPGYAWIQFRNNFNYYLGGFSGFVSPLSGTQVAINSTLLVKGQAYVITTTGTSTLADWQAVGLPPGFTPTVGQSFIAIKTGNGSGSGKVMVPLVSGVNSVEVIGDPTPMLNNSNLAANAGAWVMVQFLLGGVLTPPVDGSVCGMNFNFDGSSVSIDGL